MHNQVLLHLVAEYLSADEHGDKFKKTIKAFKKECEGMTILTKQDKKLVQICETYINDMITEQKEATAKKEAEEAAKKEKESKKTDKKDKKEKKDKKKAKKVKKSKKQESDAEEAVVKKSKRKTTDLSSASEEDDDDSSKKIKTEEEIVEPVKDTPSKNSIENRFQRVPDSYAKLMHPAMRDNSFDPSVKGGGTEWAAKASADLIVTRGKGFRHEKTKKKRGTYKGGKLDQAVRSVKFD